MRSFSRTLDLTLLGRRLSYPGVLSIVTFALGVLELRVPPGLDQGILAYFGTDILDGGVPFLTSWDHKPPGAHYLYALGFALFGRTVVAVRVFDCVYVGLIALALYDLAARWFDRLAGFVAASVFVQGYFSSLDWWNMAQPDEYMLLPLLIGLSAVSERGARRPVLRAWWGGVCFGLAFVIKFVSAAAFLPVGLLWLWDAIESRRVRGVARALLALAAGFIAVNATLLLYLQREHALANFIESQTIFNRGYVLQGFRGPPSTIFHSLALFRLPAAYMLASVALVGFIWPWSPLVELRRAATLSWRSFVGSCVLLSSVALEIIAQAKFYPYHFIPLLVPLGILAGCGASLVRASLASRAAQARAILTASVALITLSALLVPVYTTELAKYHSLRVYMAGHEDHDAYYAQFGGYGNRGGFSFLACRQAADFVRSHSVPSDRIYVFGFDPLLPFLAQRKLASRFTYNTPLIVRWGRRAWRRELMHELDKNTPRFIVFLRHDQHPWTTGERLDSYDWMIQNFPELSRYLSNEYSPCKAIEDYRFYCRRD